LIKGKWLLDYLTEEYRKMYYNNEWWGIETLKLDWKNDEWLLPYLIKWKSDLLKK
jgi:hypothetical protein